MADKLTDKTFKFELVSPERILSSEEASMVVIPGTDGDFGVLWGHAPLLSSIRPGIVSIHLPSGEEKKLFIAGGFADVSGETCSVLAEEAIKVEDIDKAQVDEQLHNLANDLSAVGDDYVKKANIERDINIAKAKLAAAA
jgi:F-type H+-transporting ATPase subunit epsilon